MLVHEIAFSLIRGVICGNDTCAEIKEELTADVCKELYALAKKHDMSPIIAHALSKTELPERFESERVCWEIV